MDNASGGMHLRATTMRRSVLQSRSLLSSVIYGHAKPGRNTNGNASRARSCGVLPRIFKKQSRNGEARCVQTKFYTERHDRSIFDSFYVWCLLASFTCPTVAAAGGWHRDRLLFLHCDVARNSRFKTCVSPISRIETRERHIARSRRDIRV
jgi:hypothetical protein